MAQVQALHNKILTDSRMRDIRRRVEVIQKKLADLQEMGVPCAFCYSSVRNTGSIFTLGDKRITDVVERYRNEILCNLMDDSHLLNSDINSSSLQEIHLILPVLPAPLDELNRTTLQSMIVGILKDLDIRWSDPKPVWWPDEIPFVPPRTVPDSFTGNWISALKAILKSVYGYFNYDIDSYIASKLESSSKHADSALKRADSALTRSQRGAHQSSDTEEEDHYEQDGVDSDEREESFWRIPPELQQQHQASSVLSSIYLTANTCRASASASAAVRTQKLTSGKAISSFTVENILMGKQSTSSISSSGTSISHSPTSSNSATSLPSPTGSGSISSSIVGTNWVSHPPVKYTKFTLLSPTAMSDEAAQKRKNTSQTSARSQEHHQEASHLAAAAAAAAGAVDEKLQLLQQQQQQHRDVALLPVSQVVYTRQTSSDQKAPPAPQVSSLSTSSTFKQLPTSTQLTSSARLCPLPVVTTLQPSSSSSSSTSTSFSGEGKVTLSKTFPPSQQYVLLVPSSSTAVTSGVQSVTHESSGSSRSGSTGNTSLTRSSIKTVSFQTPPSATSSSKVDHHSNSNSSSSRNSRNSSNRLERGLLNHHHHHHRMLSESNSFRLIAPRQKNTSTSNPNSTIAATATTTSRSKSQGRSSPKPQKLRFHMTTVVTKQKRIPVKSSMTVESPSVVSGNLQGPTNTTTTTAATITTTTTMQPVNNHSHCSTSAVPIESMITRSPNVYSSTTSKPVAVVKTERPESCNAAQPPEGRQTEGRGAGLQSGSQKKLCIQNGDSPSRGCSRTGSTEELRVASSGQRKKHRDISENSWPTASATASAAKAHPQPPQAAAGQQSREPIATRHRGRATRSYTRRKRELTFHSYEDPGTAFRAKRACRDMQS